MPMMPMMLMMRTMRMLLMMDKDRVEKGDVIINNQDTDGDDEVCNAYDEKDE